MRKFARELSPVVSKIHLKAVLANPLLSLDEKNWAATCRFCRLAVTGLPAETVQLSNLRIFQCNEIPDMF